MSALSLLRGACVWKGAEMVHKQRWVKQFPAVVLEQIDVALEQVKHLDWRQVGGW
jgi:hypothetical protein